VVTHVMPYLSSVRIARSTSSLVASAVPLLSIGGRLGSGWLTDRLDSRHISTVCFALMSVGLLFFGYVTAERVWLLVPFLILFSTGWGGNATMRMALVKEYFGRSRFGTMYGFTVGVMMAGTILGAPLTGWVFDKWGSYQGAWLALAGLAIVALVIVATTPPVGNTTRPADKPGA